MNVPTFVLVLAVASVLIVGGWCSSSLSRSAPSTGTTARTSPPTASAASKSAAALIFFAYIGFDAVSTGSEETKRPQRDLPVAIVGSLLIATILYILVSVAAVGALPADQLAGQDAPLAVALSEGAGIGWGADIVTFGALVAITSVVLTILYGQTRVALRCAAMGSCRTVSPSSGSAPGPPSC